MPPNIYTSRRLISNKQVTHPEEGTSTPLKATSDNEALRRSCRRVERKSEEPRIIHDSHSDIASSAYKDQ